VDARGNAVAHIHIPAIPALIGLKIPSAVVTLDPTFPSAVNLTSRTLRFTITSN